MEQVRWLTPEDVERADGAAAGGPELPPMLPIPKGGVFVLDHYFSIIPHEFVDCYMAAAGPAATVVFLYIYRRTKGYGADAKTISLTQFVEGLIVEGMRKDNGVGLQRAAVVRALRRLEELELVEALRSTNKGRHEPTLYRIKERRPTTIQPLRRARK